MRNIAPKQKHMLNLVLARDCAQRACRWHGDCSSLRQAGSIVASWKETSTKEITVKMSETILRRAVPALLALAGATVVTNAVAADESKEQCAGIVKAGKNDCATTMNACHGHVDSDAAPMAWIYLPKGTCERIVGAQVVHVTDPTPANKAK
jgi:uncharacterized membrane protein